MKKSTYHYGIMNKHVILIILLMMSIGISAQSEPERYVYFTKGHRATIILPITPDANKGTIGWTDVKKARLYLWKNRILKLESPISLCLRRISVLI